MPNWCEHKLTIKGSKAELIEFKKKYLVKGEFTFETIVPSPKTIEECPEEFRMNTEEHTGVEHPEDRPWFNWYEWNCNNWGTKWDACDTNVWPSAEEDINNQLEIYFNTAWSPVVRLIKKLIEDNKNLKFTCYYLGEGNEFAGIINSRGEIQEYDYDDSETIDIAVEELGYDRCDFED